MRTKRKILVSILAITVIIIIVFTALTTGLISIPRTTRLTIVPSSFTIGSGDTIMLVARLESDSFVVSGKAITWSASEGSFDKTVGEIVFYTAPTVLENRTVTITASFAGDKDYAGSSITIMGIITPSKRISTTLSIIPSEFEVQSNMEISLKAIINPPSAPSELIKWEVEGPGTVTPTTGTSVIYKAPETSEKLTVKIIAMFPGTNEYSNSNATSTGVILPIGAKVRKATFLTILPPSFTLKSDETITLTATLKDEDGNILKDKPIIWSLEGPGALSSTTGTLVTYAAPKEVAEERIVKISVAFKGDENYLPTSTTIEGEITVAEPSLVDEYVMKFTSALMKDVKFEGPVMISGRNVTKIICKNIEFEGVMINRIGLTASDITMEDVEIYITYINAHVPSLNTTLRFTSRTSITLGPLESVKFENATLRIVHMSSKIWKIKKAEVKGEYIGGEEPYKPLIFEVTGAVFENGYALSSPETYDELTDKVTKLLITKLSTPGFALTSPLEYHLNRDTNEYTYTPKWVMKTANCEALNVTIYGIYSRSLATKAPEIILEFTGEEVLPPMYGFEKGISASVYESTEHVVYLRADRLTINEVTLHIL